MIYITKIWKGAKDHTQEYKICSRHKCQPSKPPVMNQIIGRKGQMSIRKDDYEYRLNSKIKSGESVLYMIRIKNQPTTSLRMLFTEIN